ncbi:DNA cytosine methyltransferase [Corynebacterium sp. YSMAA1_1_F7]|uniref:DNA cytosine methyltransferase n=1 Tax=Corynebacterium sp. YSMAA1_1_F7 TaxID=3383590 RepID=UPI0038D24E2A
MGEPTDPNLRALGRVLGDLTEIGYDAEWTTLRASDVGAPHHRARVFLTAWPRVPNPGNKPGRGRAAHGYATTSAGAPHRCEQCGGAGTSAHPMRGRQCERHRKPAQQKQPQPNPGE